MENVYELDFYESMDVAYEYLDFVSDDLALLEKEFKNNLEGYNKLMEEIAEDKTALYSISDSLFMFLQNEDYQAFANNLILLEIVDMLHKSVFPETDLGDVYDYLDSITEDQFIIDVTESIINYNMKG